MMTVFKYSVLAIPLYLAIACVNIETKNEPIRLQVIDFMEPSYFLEGGRFVLIKQREGCLITGMGFGETGKNEYKIYFNSAGINQAHYTSYHYNQSIYDVKSAADMFEGDKVVYGENSAEDKAILELFNELTKLITADNLQNCG